MSLLEDLRGIDVSDIVSARGNVSASLSAPTVADIVGSGSAASALGGLGGSIEALRSDFPDAGALLQPVMAALGGLAGRFDTGHLPVGDLGGAIGQGLEIVIGLVGSVTGDTADFGRVFGTPLGDAMQLVGERAGHAGTILGAGADAFSALAGGAPPAHVDEVVALLAEVLLPVPHATLSDGRSAIADLLRQSGALRLPQGRFAGLNLALQAVAEARTRAALDAAIADLERVRGNTISVIADDMAFVASQAARLRPAQLLQPLAQAGAGLRLGRAGVIEFLDEFRQAIADFRVMLVNPDYDAIRAWIQGLAPMLEEGARTTLEVPIDRAVVDAKAFVRRKLRELPIRPLRKEITDFLHGLADAIASAGLDGPARAAHGALAKITSHLDPTQLTAAVQGALADVSAALHQALDGIVDALDRVIAAVDALAGEAKTVLERVAEGLKAFRAAIDTVTSDIEHLGIAAAREQMVAQLHSLRETVSKLLSSVPLPEPLKPQVEQLARLIENVDLDKAFEPVREAAAALQIPAEFAADLHDGLVEASRVVDNLIPATLAEDLSAEMAEFLATLRGFDPASLLPDLGDYIETAARMLESLDPRPAAEAIRGPFEELISALDRVHPARLLEPVTSGYDALLAQVPVPEARTLVTGMRSAFDAAGNVAARAVVEPAARSAGGSGGAGVATPSAPAPVAEPPTVTMDEVRAGDAIRMIGAIPARARTALLQLQAGPAGEAMRALDGLAAGLARDLRAVSAAMKAVGERLDADFNALLAALGPVQLNAQFALQANFSANTARFKASITVVAAASPSAMRAELETAFAPARAALYRLFTGSGGVVADLDRLAACLEATPLARLEGDLDGLLAALDPEPIAVEIDTLVHDLFAMVPTLTTELLPDLQAFVDRLKALLNHFNPGSQAQKFLGVIDVVREELDVIDPHRLVAELAEVHGVIKATLMAYDPRVLAAELAAVTQAAATALRALDPAMLLGDFDFLSDLTDRLADADPGARLAEIGGDLTQVGEELRAIDIGALIAAVNGLGPELVENFEALIEALQDEIVALLDALRYAGGSGSASVSASVSIS